MQQFSTYLVFIKININHLKKVGRLNIWLYYVNNRITYDRVLLCIIRYYLTSNNIYTKYNFLFIKFHELKLELVNSGIGHLDKNAFQVISFPSLYKI